MKTNTTKKTIILTIITLFIAISLLNCAAVQSHELKDTTAENLEIYAVITEYNDEDSVDIGAQMQTSDSDVGIEFTQGESLKAYSDNELTGESMAYLSNGGFLNLDQDYEGAISKTSSDLNYYITYTDKDGTQTTASIPNGFVPDITNIEDGNTLTGTSTDVLWDVVSLDGGLSVIVNYSSGSTSGYKRRSVDNTGSYEMDIEDCIGSGTIDLVHTMFYNYMEGFGEASVYMKNVSRKSVSFSSTSSSSLVKALSASKELTEEDIINACQVECHEGDEDFITIDDVTYDCCI